MKSNSTENLIADQLFKITKADENISNYLIDCGSAFNCQTSNKKIKKISNGIA